MRWLREQYIHATKVRRVTKRGPRNVLDFSPEEIARVRQLPSRNRGSGIEHMKRMRVLGQQAARAKGITMREIGRQGGKATVAKHGADHMRTIASKAGAKSKGTERS